MLRANGFTTEVDLSDPLRGTGLVNVFARRDTTAVAASRPATEQKWSAPEALVEDVLTHLRAHLPDHMVPASVTLLDQLPLTSSGKLDRRALPRQSTGQAAPSTSRPASGIREHALSELLAHALGLPSVSPDDNFQHLGGHSLLLAKLSPRIRAALGGAVTVSDILRESTVANLVKIADAPNGGAFEPVLPLRLWGTGAPLYCVPGADGLSWDYLALLDDVESDRPVCGLQAHGAAPASVEELAAAHVARVRRIQRRGPYHLCDHAIGAVIARKVAALLRAEGHEVAFVAIGGGDWSRADDLFGATRQAPAT